jgi:hypothetical protein
MILSYSLHVEIVTDHIVCHIFVIYHKVCSLITNFRNRPKNPLIPQRPKTNVGNPVVN